MVSVGQEFCKGLGHLEASLVCGPGSKIAVGSSSCQLLSHITQGCVGSILTAWHLASSRLSDPGKLGVFYHLAWKSCSAISATSGWLQLSVLCNVGEMIQGYTKVQTPGQRQQGPRWRLASTEVKTNF